MSPANLDELPSWARDLLEGSRVGHLSYLDDRDRPRVLPVTFAVAAGAVWTAIDHKPKRARSGEIARVRYLRQRPQAALCVDHYEDDWTHLAWVQALGTVEVVDPDDAPGAKPDVPRALGCLRAKYEQYADHPPAGPLIALRPERVLCWSAAEG